MDAETQRLLISTGGVVLAAMATGLLTGIFSVQLANRLTNDRARQDRVRDDLLHRIGVTRLWTQLQLDRLAAAIDGNVEKFTRADKRLDELVDVDLDVVGDDEVVERWLDAIAEMEQAALTGGYGDLLKRSARAFIEIRDALDAQRARALHDEPLDAKYNGEEERANRLERRLEYYASRLPKKRLAPWRASLRRFGLLWAAWWGTKPGYAGPIAGGDAGDRGRLNIQDRSGEPPHDAHLQRRFAINAGGLGVAIVFAIEVITTGSTVPDFQRPLQTASVMAVGFAAPLLAFGSLISASALLVGLPKELWNRTFDLLPAAGWVGLVVGLGAGLIDAVPVVTAPLAVGAILAVAVAAFAYRPVEAAFSRESPGTRPGRTPGP